jgi:hypothetical protein
VSIPIPQWRRLARCTLATAAAVTIIAVGPASAADVPHGLSLNAIGASLQRQAVAKINGAPILGGFTSQGGPVVLEISKDAKRLQSAETALIMRCTSGSRFVYAEAAFRLAIKANGRVHISATTSTNDASGDVIKTSHSFSATINRRRWTASGVWRVHLDVTLSSGNTDSCDSGSVSFQARL